MTEQRIYERTIYEAKLDASYGVRFHELNGRLFRRLDLLFGFVGLFGGTGAFAAAVGQWQAAGMVAGAMVASAAILERLTRPAERAADHDSWRARYAALLADIESGKLQPLSAIDAELRSLQGQGASGVAALAVPAFNANLRSHGRSDAMVPAPIWQRLLALLA